MRQNCINLLQNIYVKHTLHNKEIQVWNELEPGFKVIEKYQQF